MPVRKKQEDDSDVPINNVSKRHYSFAYHEVLNHELEQEEILNTMKKNMLTEADVRRIFKEELAKLLAEVGDNTAAEPFLKVINQNKTVNTLDIEEKTQYPERIPFPTRMLDADDTLKECYNQLKAEALAYGLKSRLSNTGDTFRLHTKTYMKISIAGNSLKCYFALKPESYANSGIPVIDAGLKHMYKEIPCAFKVRSPLSVRRAKQLLSDACRKDNITIGDIYERDWVAPLKDFEPQLGKKDDED